MKSENIQYPVSENSQHPLSNNSQFQNPTDVALMMFKLSDRKKVYHHAKNAALKINGFAQSGHFTVLVIPKADKVADSFLIRNDFTVAYNRFLDAVERNNLLQVLSIYKRVDKVAYRKSLRPLTKKAPPTLE